MNDTKDSNRALAPVTSSDRCSCGAQANPKYGSNCWWCGEVVYDDAKNGAMEKTMNYLRLQLGYCRWIKLKASWILRLAHHDFLTLTHKLRVACIHFRFKCLIFRSKVRMLLFKVRMFINQRRMRRLIGRKIVLKQRYLDAYGYDPFVQFDRLKALTANPCLEGLNLTDDSVYRAHNEESYDGFSQNVKDQPLEPKDL